MSDLLDFVDLFAGPGGWDVAAHRIGLNGIGIEWDHAACETRRAAGLPTIEGDVRRFGPWTAPSRGLIASPPCQTFSKAGKGSGRAALDLVTTLASQLATREEVDLSGFEDERTALVLEPLRWALMAKDRGTPYEWLAFEQVPTALPAWEAFAPILEAEGYSVATGVLSAEEYGVPQTRKRAVLVARYNGPVALPAPTHRAYRKGIAQADGDPALLPWVSMAEALGWTEGLVGFPRRSDGQAEVLLDGVAYRERDLRPTSEPAQVVTEKARSWSLIPDAQARATVRDLDEPAPTLTSRGHASGGMRWAETPEGLPRVNDQSGTPVDLGWPEARPSTTVATRDLVQHPGATANRYNGSTKSRNDGIRVTPAEAATLQSFPGDHPWQGRRTKVFQQIGNAVPPLLAEAVLQAVV